MLNKYYLSILSAMLCFFGSCTKNDPHIEEAYSMIHRINKKFKNTSLTPFGTGGSFQKDIEKISLTYMVYIESMDEEGARKILIDTVETILKEINSEPSIRPYLRECPFQVNRLELIIGFNFGRLVFLPPPNFAMIRVYDGKVKYSQYINDQLTDISSSSYSEEYFKLYGVYPPDRTVQE